MNRKQVIVQLYLVSGDWVIMTLLVWFLTRDNIIGAPWLKGFDVYRGLLDQNECHNMYPLGYWDNDKRIPLAQNNNASRTRCMTEGSDCVYDFFWGRLWVVGSMISLWMEQLIISSNIIKMRSHSSYIWLLLILYDYSVFILIISMLEDGKVLLKYSSLFLFDT